MITVPRQHKNFLVAGAKNAKSHISRFSVTLLLDVVFAFAVPLLALNLKSTSSLLRSFVCKSFPASISSHLLNPPLLSLLFSFVLPEILGDLPTLNIVIIHR